MGRCGVDVGDCYVAVVLFRGDRGGVGGGAVGGWGGEGEVFEAVVDGRVVVMPHALFGGFGFVFCDKELGAVGGFFGGEGVHARETFFEEHFGYVFSVDVHAADEAADFVHGFDFDLYIALVAAAVGEVVGFLTEWFGFVGGVAGGFGTADAGEDEGEFGIFFGDEDGEAGAGFDKVDDSGDALFVLEGGEDGGGLLNGHGVILVCFGCWRFLRPHSFELGLRGFFCCE